MNDFLIWIIVVIITLFAFILYGERIMELIYKNEENK